MLPMYVKPQLAWNKNVLTVRIMLGLRHNTNRTVENVGVCLILFSSGVCLDCLSQNLQNAVILVALSPSPRGPSFLFLFSFLQLRFCLPDNTISCELTPNYGQVTVQESLRQVLWEVKSIPSDISPHLLGTIQISVSLIGLVT